MKYNEILHGSALDQLKTLDSESVDCCITSPPYWALRDYKTPGQLGLEPTFQEYIKKLVDIFSQVRRVLKKSGACWVNMGDTYSRAGTSNVPDSWTKGYQCDKRWITKTPDKSKLGIPEKSLCCIPERFAIAMVDQGWILRNKIIWYKPNCMPSSAKDRFTVDWEYLFFFTKSQKYYFETQYEPQELESGWAKQRALGINNKISQKWLDGLKDGSHTTKMHKWFSELEDVRPNPLGRIKRCVWKIPTQPFSEAHFAVFPPALVATPLKATCPEYICKRCGKAREKILDETGEYVQLGHSTSRKAHAVTLNNTSGFVTNLKKERVESGLTDCDCNAGFDGGIVLDPFAGAGTVALVAMQNARNFVGIELNEEYIKMAMERLKPYLFQTRLI